MTDTTIDKKEFQLACSRCSLSQLCLPLGLSEDELSHLDSLVQKRRIIDRGEFLYREGAQFTNLFALHSGSLKAYKVDGHGDERVTGFYLPGEILGFHAIHPKRYAVSTKALEVSSICEIPYDELFNFANSIPTLQKHLLELMSQRLTSDFTIDPNSHAEERMAKLLLSISSRLQRRGFSASKFLLSMSRQDIGNYLGLATETVSRILTHLQKENILAVDRREVEILDVRKLQLMSCGSS